jgi:O-antigen/teichoic acid export membrane protein
MVDDLIGPSVVQSTPLTTANEAAKTGTRALAGGAWLGGAAIVQVIAQLAVVGILARILSPKDFGIVASAAVIMEISQSISQMGMGVAIVQKSDVTDRDIRTAFTTTIMGSSIISILLFVSAALIAGILRVPAATHVIQALSLLFLFRGLSVVAEALAARQFKYRLLALRRVVGYLIGYAFVGITAAFMGAGPWALVAAQLTEALVTTVLLVAGIRHPMRPLLDRNSLSKLSNFGGGIVFGRIANTLALQIDYVIVARLMGPGALGVYSRSYQIMRLPALTIGKIVEDVLFPALAAAQNDSIRLSKTFVRVLKLMNLALIPSSVLLFICANDVVALLLGAKWKSAIVLLQVFSFAVAFRSTQRLAATTARALGKSWQVAWREAIYFVLVLAGACIGAQSGLKAVSIFVSLAIVGQFVLHVSLVSRLLQIPVRRLVRAHVDCLPLALLVGATSLAGQFACVRLGGSAGLESLVVSMIFLITLVPLAIRLAPERFLMKDGVQLICTVSNKLPPRVRPLVLSLVRNAVAA